MDAQLDADDIARITAGVLAKLGDQAVAPGNLSAAVRAATAGKEPPGPANEPASAPAAPPGKIADTPGTRTRIILASFGLNRPGIVASISAVLAENNCSIEDMSQRIMQEFYTLIMIVDIASSKADFSALSEKLKAVEERLGVTIFAQHEDVFRYMHRV
jgi:ACT domain-containing protein